MVITKVLTGINIQVGTFFEKSHPAARPGHSAGPLPLGWGCLVPLALLICLWTDPQRSSMMEIASRYVKIANWKMAHRNSGFTHE
jgi:hypothetical protein